MTIQPTTVTPAPSLYTTPTAAAAPKQDMDKEVFLALLVAQLRNQDPTSPMDTTEMMAQSTQMASMEQLTGLADTTRESFSLQMRIAASGLVGQQVSYLDENGVAQTGVATSVSFVTDVPMVTVGDVEVPLDAVSAVRTTAGGTSSAPGTAPADPASPSDPTDPTTSSGSAGTAA